MITNRTYADLNNEETKKKIIELLNENGYIVNENDDDKTLTNVIRKFQSDKKCGFADGFVGKQTLKAMGIEVKEAEEIINPHKEKEEVIYYVTSGCVGMMPYILLSGLLFCLLMYMC